MNRVPDVAKTEKQRGSGSLFLGLALVFGPLFLVSLLVIVGDIEMLGFPLLFMGLSQWVYLAPIIAYQHRQKKGRTIQGLLIGAGVVFLLNAMCFGFFFGAIQAF